MREETVYIVKGADGKKYPLTAEQYVLLCSVMLKKSAE
jgi:hypothetical protein